MFWNDSGKTNVTELSCVIKYSYKLRNFVIITRYALLLKLEKSNKSSSQNRAVPRNDKVTQYHIFGSTTRLHGSNFLPSFIEPCSLA